MSAGKFGFTESKDTETRDLIVGPSLARPAIKKIESAIYGDMNETQLIKDDVVKFGFTETNRPTRSRRAT